MPEFEADDDLSVYSYNSLMSEGSLNDETLPLPNFSPVVETPQEFVADKIGSEYTKTQHKCSIPDPIPASSGFQVGHTRFRSE